MSISSNFPTIRPSLLLDFARSQALDPRVTFTRSTTATRTDSDGLIETVNANAPRFDFDPLTGLCKGLLIEEQRTNLLTYSDLSVNSYSDGVTVTANSTVSPDGTVNATLLTSTVTGGSNTCYADRGATVTTSTTYTFSVFLKAGTSPNSTITLYFTGGTFRQAVGTVNWSTLAYTVTSTDSTATGTITNYGNGWYRLTLTYTSGNNTVSTSRVYVRDQGSNNVTGETVYAWGRQTEAGAFPTSYIPTTTAQVTRSADLASMTGTNFSSWFNPAEGAIYCESATVNLASNRGTWAIGNNSLGFGSGNMMYEVYDSGIGGRRITLSFTNGSQQVLVGTEVSQTINTPSKGAFVYTVNNFAQSTNAVSPSTDTSGTVPIGVTGLSIGSLTAGWSGASQYLNGYIKKLAYYPARLTNAQLQALTGA